VAETSALLEPVTGKGCIVNQPAALQARHSSVDDLRRELAAAEAAAHLVLGARARGQKALRASSAASSHRTAGCALALAARRSGRARAARAPRRLRSASSNTSRPFGVGTSTPRLAVRQRLLANQAFDLLGDLGVLLRNSRAFSRPRPGVSRIREDAPVFLTSPSSIGQVEQATLLGDALVDMMSNSVHAERRRHLFLTTLPDATTDHLGALFDRVDAPHVRRTEA